MWNITSIVTPEAYFPEIYAYQKYFKNTKDFEFNIIEANNLQDIYFESSDIYLLKMGVDSRFGPYPKNKKSLIVHDYTSCSTGSFPKIKNRVKKIINKKADINIFLNERVRQEYGFPVEKNTVIRDMGVDSDFFYDSEEKGEHIFIYAGSISKSRNIELVLNAFKENKKPLALVGKVDDDIFNDYKAYKNINFLGVLTRSETATELKKSIYGINITPAIYPYDFQTSTKTLEYCAANLKVICNTNSWNRKFQLAKNANFYETEDFKLGSSVENFPYKIPQVKEFEWSRVIKNSGIQEKLLKMLRSNTLG